MTDVAIGIFAVLGMANVRRLVGIRSAIWEAKLKNMIKMVSIVRG